MIGALAKEGQLLEEDMTTSSLADRLPRETIFAKAYWTAHNWPSMHWGIAGKVLLISGLAARDWLFGGLVLERMKDHEGMEIAVPRGLEGQSIPVVTDLRTAVTYVSRIKRLSELVQEREHALVLCYFPGIEKLPEEKGELGRLFLEAERELAFWESYVTGLLDCVFHESISPVTRAVCRTPDDTGAANLWLTKPFHTGHERDAITRDEMKARLGQLDKTLREEPKPEKLRLRLSLHWYGRAVSEPVGPDQFLFYYIVYEVLAGEKNGDTDYKRFCKDLFEALPLDGNETNRAMERLKSIRNRRHDLVHRGDQNSPFPIETLKGCVQTVLMKRLRMDQDRKILSDLRTGLLRGTP